MATAAHTFDTFDTIPAFELDSVAGGFSWGRVVDNGNRYGTAGGLVGAGIGAGVGSLAAGVGAVPGAGIGGAIGGVGGFVGGAAYDAYQQYKGR